MLFKSVEDEDNNKDVSVTGQRKEAELLLVARGAVLLRSAKFACVDPPGRLFCDSACVKHEVPIALRFVGKTMEQLLILRPTQGRFSVTQGWSQPTVGGRGAP